MYAIGVDLGGTNVKLGVVSEQGKIVNKYSLKTCAEEGPDKVISQILKGIEKLKSVGGLKIKGIGIGAPGVVKHKKGIVEHPPNIPGWGKVPLGKILAERTGANVFVENDANAAAVGEMIFGAGKELDSFIMVTLGTGVGGGIIRKGKVFRGETNGAGEIGHVSINYRGPKCNCGSRGCVEAYVGNSYLTARTVKALKKHPESVLNDIMAKNSGHLSPRVINEAVKLNDEFALSIVNETGALLGCALASVVNVLDIGNVIIGGGVSGFGNILFVNVEKEIRRRVLKSLRDRVKVVPAELKNNAGVKGASSLVFYNL